mgnify:CR=1 FL=1
MHRITHRNHINALPGSTLKTFITKRYNQQAEGTDIPPIILLVSPGDIVTGPDFAFLGNRGLLSDAYEEHTPGQSGFIRPYEWVSHWTDLGIYEALFLQNYDDGYWILIPEDIVEAHPDLKWVLTDPSQGGLSDPQPLYG